MQGNVALTPHLRRTGNVLGIGGVAAILIATLLPASGRSMDAHFCLICGPLGGVDVILNVLLFIPLGAGLALSGVPWRRAVVTACLLSIAVETTQLLFIPGRDATLGDVITNTLGAMLGVALVQNARLWLRPTPRIAAILGLAWGAIFLTIQIVSSFAFTASIPDSPVYGQIARVLGDYDVFRGRVVGASIDGVTIRDARLSDIDSVETRLRHGDPVVATVVPGDPTIGIAPIVRVADSDQAEIALLAQHENNFLFGVRTGASALRLRAPLFGLAGVFPIGTPQNKPTGALTLSGRYLPRQVELSSQSNTEFHREIPLTASLGWTLFLPWQWVIEDTSREHLLSCLWVALLLVPFGYWASCATGRPTAESSHVVIWVLGLAIISSGLGLAPVAFGLSLSPVREWSAAIAGALLGGALCLSYRKHVQTSWPQRPGYT